MSAAKSSSVAARSVRAPTMKDVAREAGVHQSTVSLALRNQPGIPVATRERVRAAADRIGYRPDPALDAFNFHRLAHQPARSSRALAFVADAKSWDEFSRRPANAEILRGVRHAAAASGFVLESFLVGSSQLSSKRLDQILRARNTSCLIVGPLALETRGLSLDWTGLCAVRIESFHLQTQIDIVAPDHRGAARRAFEELRRGDRQRRVGLIVREDEDLRLDGAVMSGFLTAQACVPDLPEIPPYLLGTRESVAGAGVRRWLRTHGVNAMLLGESRWRRELTETAKEEGLSLEAFASLDLAGAEAGETGIDLQYFRLGEFAVESVAIRRQANRRGESVSQTATVLPFSWKPGR